MNCKECKPKKSVFKKWMNIAVVVGVAAIILLCMYLQFVQGYDDSAVASVPTHAK